MSVSCLPSPLTLNPQQAWSTYKNAAVVDMVLQTLPRVAAEIAAPLSSAKKVTLVAGPNGELGAAKLTAEVLEIMTRVPEAIKRMTGVDLEQVRTLGRGFWLKTKSFFPPTLSTLNVDNQDVGGVMMRWVFNFFWWCAKRESTG